jgi:hypothetical protein
MYTYKFVWKNTRYGPINPELVSRMNQRCMVILTASNGTRLIRFEDGFEAAVMFYSVRKDGS